MRASRTRRHSKQVRATQRVALFVGLDSANPSQSANVRRMNRCQAKPTHMSSLQRTRCRFEPMSKRRNGYPSETQVKRGSRTIKGGEIELLERLGNNDPCPCGSGRRFQAVLPKQRPLLTGPVVPNTGASGSAKKPGGGPRPPAPCPRSSEDRAPGYEPGREGSTPSGGFRDL